MKVLTGHGDPARPRGNREDEAAPCAADTPHLRKHTINILGQQVFERIKRGHDIRNTASQRNAVHRRGDIRRLVGEINAEPINPASAEFPDECIVAAPEIHDEARAPLEHGRIGVPTVVGAAILRSIASQRDVFLAFLFAASIERGRDVPGVNHTRTPGLPFRRAQSD